MVTSLERDELRAGDPRRHRAPARELRDAIRGAVHDEDRHLADCQH